MKYIEGIPVWGHPVDSDAVSQIQECQRHGGVKSALMADHHVGYSMPIGGVVAYQNAVSPSGVGYDIGCGNKAVRLDLKYEAIAGSIKKIMDDIVGQISFGMGLSNNFRVEHELFDDVAWKLPMVKPLKQKAQAQLGTVGGGNHYVDLFRDENDNVWIGVHFGSRGLGHKIATHFLEVGGGKEGMFVPPTVFQLGTPVGDDYLEAMRLGGLYAYAGRDWVTEQVRRILGAKVVDEVHNHHNYAWKEEHCGESLVVVRKGATPAFPGQRGFVGGSMGDISVILEGMDSEESRAGLYSTVHGAGRVMSRRKAIGKWNKQTREYEGGAVSMKSMLRWVSERGVELRGGGPDESPHVYKRLPEVLEHHGQTVKILHTLTPVGVAMAGSDVFDPYKD